MKIQLLENDGGNPNINKKVVIDTDDIANVINKDKHTIIETKDGAMFWANMRYYDFVKLVDSKFFATNREKARRKLQIERGILKI